jgi:uncharacterized protein YukE
VSRLVVDLAQLADLVDRMEQFQAHLCAARDDAARVQQLHGQWTGTAAAAQADAQARWAAGAVDVHESLAALRSIASAARANYEAALLANRRMWGA